MGLKPKTRQTIDQLRETAKVLARISSRLDAEVVTAAEEGFEALEVTNFDQCQRGLEYLNNYVAAVSSASLAAKQGRGEMGERSAYSVPIVSERERKRLPPTKRKPRAKGSK
ncbi:MAG TPA: hypothetical protein PLI18_15745 [Pirellulaceae bacterium]|nr:hypothetical protein [Pirellulaceae bacterium]